MTPHRLRFPSLPDSAGEIRRQVTQIAREAGLDEATLHRVRLAVSEAVTNAIVHAHAGGDQEITVAVDVDPEELTVIIADQGTGIRPRADSPGLGLGLTLISSLASRMEIVSAGAHGATEVHMTFRAEGVA